MVVDRKNLKDAFKKTWEIWQRCILIYATECKPTAALKCVLDYEESDEGIQLIHLGTFFTFYHRTESIEDNCSFSY